MFRGVQDQANAGEVQLIRKLASLAGYRVTVNGTTGLVRCQVGDGTLIPFAVGTTNFLDGRWHTVIMDVNRAGTTMNLYVDDPDTVEGTVSLTGLATIAGTGVLNFSASSTEGFTGLIDGCRLYRRRLTTAERKTVMQNTKRYRVATEERTGILNCAQQDQSTLNMNFVGETEWREKYQVGSEICVLHDIVSMQDIKSGYTFKDKSLDDETIHENDLVGQTVTGVTVTHVNTATSDRGDQTSATMTVTMPTFSQDDVVLVIIGMTEASVDPMTAIVTPPTGWTEIDNPGVNITSVSACRLQVYYRVMQSADPSTVDFIGPTSRGFRAIASSYSGCDITTPIDVSGTSTGGADTSAICPDITTTVINTMILRIAANDDSTNTLSNAGVTLRGNGTRIVSGGSNGLGSSNGDEGIQAAIGATGTSTYTISGAEEWGTFTIALAPAASEAAKAATFIEGRGRDYDAVDFDVHPDDESLAVTGSYSFGCKFRPDVIDADQTLFTKADESSHKSHRVVINSNNTVRGSIQDGTTNIVLDTTTLAAVGVDMFVWYNVNIATQLMEVFANGVSQGTVSIAALTDITKVNNRNRMTFGILDPDRIQPYDGTIEWARIYDRLLTQAEITDLQNLTQPDQFCLFDGVVLERPQMRKGNIPFSLVAKDFLYDRLVNEDLTLQFAEKIDLGTMMKRAVTRSSLVDFFDTANVADVGVTTEGKYFIRTQIVDVFKFITDAANSTFFSIRRGTSRYLHHILVKSEASGVSITPKNIVRQGKSQNPLFYNFTDDLFNQSNIIQVEGGFEFTIEEQITFENDTFRASDDFYYALKVTPEFIKYGRLDIFMKKIGNPTFDIQIELREDKAGDPAGPEVPALGAVNIPKEDVDATKKQVAVDFDVELITTPSGGTQKLYWLVFIIGGDATNNYEFEDNGSVSDTNMETSTDDVTWSTVGYTFRYDWSNKLRVISQTKDGEAVRLYNIRKITVSDPEITKFATARQLARGLLARLGKVQQILQNMTLKDITKLPCAGQTVNFTDALTGFDAAFEVQKMMIPFARGRNGEIRRPVITIGDRPQDPQKLLENMLATLRKQIEAEQPVVTDTQAFAESFKLGIIVTGAGLTPVTDDQQLGIDVTQPNQMEGADEDDADWDLDDI